MTTSAPQCSRCSQNLAPEDLFCPACGAPVVASTVPAGEAPGTLTRALFMGQDLRPQAPCIACRRPMPAGEPFCPHCGASQARERPAAGMPEPPSTDMWEGVQVRLRKALLGQYEFAGKVASGGMAAVFFAHEIALNRKVAIKVMAPSFLADNSLVERFRQEARTVAALRHPHIVNIFSVGEADRLHYFAMEFIGGRTMAEVIKQDGPVAPHLVAAILFQVGAALTYAHRRQVVHRDIKPANIMLDDDGNSIVTDFGIAMVAEAPRLTIAGGAIGTPTYMSPEQCRGGVITGASDQYSLGIVAYELLTGAPPFSGTPDALMGAHVFHPPRPLEEVRPDCPPAMAAAIARMLAKSPAERFPSPTEAAIAAGGVALNEDDPIRQELIALGRRSESRGQELKASTPASPLPYRESLPTLPAVAEILVGQYAEPLQVGARIRLGVRVSDVAGEELANPVLAWESDDPAVASVEGDGTVTGRAPGSATISVSCYGQVATSAIQVVPAAESKAERPVGVRYTPVSTSRIAREDLPDTRERRVPRPPPRPSAVARPVPLGPPLWAKWVAGVAVLLVLLLLIRLLRRDTPAPSAPDTTKETPPPAPVITQLVLSPVAETLRVADSAFVQAQASDPSGRPLQPEALEWTSDAPAAVRVDGVGTTALIRATGPGSATITARSGAVAARMSVVVQPAAKGELTLSASRRELTVGDTVQLSAGNAAPGTLRFRSNTPSIASVSSRGLVRALRPGVVEIVASAGSRQTATLMITVRPAPVTTGRIQLSTSVVGFEITAGAGPPLQQTISVTWSGSGEVTVGKPSYTPSAPAWLSLRLSSEVLIIRPTAEVSGLVPGTYTAQVPLTAGTAKSALTVSLTVKPAAPVAAPAAASLREELDQLLSEFNAAINAGDSARIRRSAPLISRGAMADLLEIAKKRGNSLYDLQLRDEPSRPEASEVKAQVTAQYVGQRTTGRVLYQYTFVRREGRWVIADWRQVRRQVNPPRAPF